MSKPKKPTLRISRKWKWAAKDDKGDIIFSTKRMRINEWHIGKWVSPGWQRYSGVHEIPGPWSKSLHKRVGDEWVRVEE